MVPPVRAIEVVPEIAVTVPPQVLVRPLGVATVSPAGRGSLNVAPVSGVGLEVVMRKVSTVVPPGVTVVGLNDFVNPGAETPPPAGFTISVAVAGAEGGACSLRNGSDWFIREPVAVAMTDTDTKQCPLAGMLTKVR